MQKEEDVTVKNDVVESVETKLEGSNEIVSQEAPPESAEPRAETYEEREARLDAEEKIVKRNCIIFGVLPLFIGFWIFCYYFFQYLEAHKISSVMPTSIHCERNISDFESS